MVLENEIKPSVQSVCVFIGIAATGFELQQSRLIYLWPWQVKWPEI